MYPEDYYYNSFADDNDKLEVEDHKYLNISRFEIAGTQLHIYPVYSERDLMIENDVEVFVIELADLPTDRHGILTKTNRQTTV